MPRAMQRLVGSLALCVAGFGAVADAAEFAHQYGAFKDEARNRKIPYKVYYPKALQGEYPVILFSHGLGGSRDGNEHFGKHLAGNGFVVIHLQHAGSDGEVLQGARGGVQARLQQSLRQPLNAQNRFLDVLFVAKELTKLNEDDPILKGHLNLSALGMAGHSYGAISTMVAAGERYGARLQSQRLPELKAGVLLSPSPPRDGADPASVYADVKIPLFHITGTQDESLVDARSVSPEARVVPYRSLSVPEQYLLVLDQADHMTFSGRRIGTRAEAKLDKQHLVAVLNGSVAFFKASLQEDGAAEQWLQNEFRKTLGARDVFEFK